MNKKRLIVLFIIVSVLMIVLVGAIFNLTILRSEELQNIVESQWTRSVKVSAKRGNILGADGEVLAQSASTQSVLLKPGEIEDAGVIARLLAPILDMDEKYIYDLALQEKSQVYLKRHITEEQVEKIRTVLNMNEDGTESKSTIKGVGFFIETKRYYPFSDSLSQIIGYTTIDGEGQTGLEKNYDKYLSGEDGMVLMQCDAYGNAISGTEQVYIEASDGLNVCTTIDTAIQSFAWSAAEECMEATNASGVVAIAMNPSNSDILAVAELPAMDLNNIDRSDISRLNELSRNRAFIDSYEPGSTFKIITTAAALDSGTKTTASEFDCIGYASVNSEKIKCWRSGNPHGHQDLKEALANSCNPCFVKMALDMGKAVFYDYIKRFGFGSNTGVESLSESAGIVTDPKYVTESDLARIGFGQSIAVTPLQLLNSVCAVINGGTLNQPRLVRSLEDAEGKTYKEFETVSKGRIISQETSATMRELLEYVVSSGSGSMAKISGYSVGGKTGTAQLYGKDGKIVTGKHISSFIGFAPADNPQIAVLFIVYEAQTEVDYGSVIAAPYAKTIIEKTMKYLGIKPEDSEGMMVSVPMIEGMKYEEAKALLEGYGLKLEAENQSKIIVQLPQEGTSVVKGSFVYAVTEETGDEIKEDELPSVIGKTVFEAVTIFEEYGVNLKVVGGYSSSSSTIRTENIVRDDKTGSIVVEVSCIKNSVDNEDNG